MFLNSNIPTLRYKTSSTFAMNYKDSTILKELKIRKRNSTIPSYEWIHVEHPEKPLPINPLVIGMLEAQETEGQL
jgi:hypothetical protein